MLFAGAATSPSPPVPSPRPLQPPVLPKPLNPTASHWAKRIPLRADPARPQPRLSHVRLHLLEERDEQQLSRRIIALSRSNKVRSALDLYFSMEAEGIDPNPHACNSILSCLLRNDSLEDALRVFEAMRKRDVSTAHAYSLVLKAVACKRGCDSAVRMFLDVEREAVPKRAFDVVVYNTMISACGRAGNWMEVERMWRKLKESGLRGTEVTYSLLVSAFVQCHQPELALSAYYEMVREGLRAGEGDMRAVIAACASEGNWQVAFDILNQMLDGGARPSIVIFNEVINCLGKAGEADLAFKTYDLMKSSDRSPDTYTWNALLNALYRCKRYADCLRLFESVSKLLGSGLNIHLCNTALMSCQKLGSWEHSLQILWQMETSGMQVPTATYNLVIGACETARKPKVALQVYQHMVHRNCLPDTFTFLTLIRTCIWGSLWTEVEIILEHVEPNASLYNALIHGLCLRGKVVLAKKLYAQMRCSGLKPDGKTRALMLQHIPKDSLRHPSWSLSTQRNDYWPEFADLTLLRKKCSICGLTDFSDG